MGKITFKGVDSDTITGLLISEQPAITRAPRKTESIDVDGRDGDLVNYLGYDTYVKTAVIGLHGSYDIDEIANFFTGEGWVIFSNEPTKKYWGRITSQIDFESLIRFRTAKVKWTVQPYKKLVTESNVSGSTSPLTVVNQGYEDCKPLIKVEGTPDDEITLDVDGIDFATVTIPASGEIYLDGENVDAYDATGKQNDKVVGNFAVLPAGSSDIGWTGTATVTITPNSRWL